MVTDKVGDLLIRVKNGYMASRKEVAIPYSKLNLAIAKLLSMEGYVGGIKDDGKMITAALKYDSKAPALTDVTRVSKPGRRVYMGSKSLPRVLNGLGMVIVSTPKGIMSDKQARKEGVGGEVMALIW